MEGLKLELNIFTSCGYWRPVDWDQSTIGKIYDYISYTITFIMYTYMLSGVFDMIFNAKNVDDYTANCFMMLTIVSSCCKAGTMLIKHERIVELVRMLENSQCLPKDEVERKIESSFDKKKRSNTIAYLLMTECSVSIVVVKYFFSNALNGILPFRAWFPFDHTRTPLLFWIMYAHQMIGQIAAATVNVGSECLVSGFMIKACTQIEILKHRLQLLTGNETSSQNAENELHFTDDLDEKFYIDNCIKHHNFIYKFCEKLNQIFGQIMFIQFSVTVLVLCSSLYQLVGKQEADKLFVIALMSYLPCLLVQIFIYCWYGNEVTVKSMEVAECTFGNKWSLLSSATQKKLLLVTARSRYSIKFSYWSLVTLSVDSFAKLMKMSYSVFSILNNSK